MNNVIAERRLKQFQQKFGEAMVKFATHAALPVVLNSELVHLLRLNFFYSDSSIGYFTEAEFLLSSFCREIGEDLYEIEPAMRTVLLQKLYQETPELIKEIAALLWQYTERYSPWRTRKGLQQAQLLTALNFLDWQKASEWFQTVETSEELSQDEWFVAMKEQAKILNNYLGDEFSFEVVTVDAKGEILQREQRTAFQVAETINDVALEMVYIPSGEFMMGSPESEKGGYKDERPQHKVTIKQAFYMGKYPITQAQWQAVMGNNPSHFKGEKRPVEEVSWNEAVEFCRRLSEKSGKEYRLPSEAEWEYACRAGTTTPFYFGEMITTDLANYNGNYPYASGPKGVYRKKTTEVGSFPPNAFGLYDMHGNVWEWCADAWHDNYEGAPSDGSIWRKDENADRLSLRGGSWSGVAVNVRSANRDRWRPAYRFNDLGFRVVRL